MEDVSCVFGTLGYWKKTARDIYDRYNTEAEAIHFRWKMGYHDFEKHKEEMKTKYKKRIKDKPHARPFFKKKTVYLQTYTTIN